MKVVSFYRSWNAAIGLPHCPNSGGVPLLALAPPPGAGVRGTGQGQKEIAFLKPFSGPRGLSVGAWASGAYSPTQTTPAQ